MAVDLESCNACFCHTLGLIFAVSSCALTALGVACVSLFDETSSWYKLGLGGFGVAGVLAILLVAYACFAMSRSWKMFGCCGIWTGAKAGGVQRRLENNNPYEMRINPRPISNSMTDNPPTSSSNVIGMV